MRRARRNADARGSEAGFGHSLTAMSAMTGARACTGWTCSGAGAGRSRILHQASGSGVRAARLHRKPDIERRAAA